MEIHLKEQTALVSGGTRGIGAAISESLLNSGATVIAIYQKNAQAASAWLEKQKQAGYTKAYVVQCDVAHDAEVKKIATELLKQHVKIDIVINNAGITLIWLHYMGHKS